MFRNYLMAALRALARDRLHAALTVLSLVVGFTAAILIGVFVRDEFRYDHFPGHERVGVIALPLEIGTLGKALLLESPRTVAGLAETSVPEVEAATRLVRRRPPLIRGNTEAVEDVAWVDADFFSFFPFNPLAGDLKGALTRPDAIVLTRGLARKYFGRDTPVGEVLNLNPALAGADTPYGQPHAMRVTAVIEDLPSETHIRAKAFVSGLSSASPMLSTDPNLNSFQTYVRLRPSNDPAEAMRRASKGVAALVHAYPKGMPLAGQPMLRPIGELHLPPDGLRSMNDGPFKALPLLRVLVGFAAVILIAAGVNFISLMTARAGRRAVEIGVRKVAGAPRHSLVAQFMAEAFGYVLLALILAIALAELLLPVLNRILSRTMSFDYFTDPVTAGLLAAVTVVVGLAAGAYPALVLSSFKPASALKGDAVGSSGAMARQALVVVQVLVLVVVGIVTATAYRQSQLVIENAMKMGGDEILLIDQPCTSTLKERIKAVQGVRQAACTRGFGVNFMLGMEAATPGQPSVPVNLEIPEIGAFGFFGIKTVAGRLHEGGSQTLVINDAARKALGFKSAAEAIGKTLSYGNPREGAGKPQMAPIGAVTADFVVRGPASPTVYAAADAEGMVEGVSVKLIGSDIPATLRRLDALWKDLGQVRPMNRTFYSEFMQSIYEDVTLLVRVAAACAAASLLIACLGMFSLSAFVADLRTKEIGVRKALGARSGDILRLLLGQFSKPVILANLIAWPAAYAGLAWWLRQFAEPAGQPFWVFLCAGGASLLIAWATVFVHAWAVARQKPVTALRYE